MDGLFGMSAEGEAEMSKHAPVKPKTAATKQAEDEVQAKLSIESTNARFTGVEPLRLGQCPDDKTKRTIDTNAISMMSINPAMEAAYSS